MAKSVVVVCDRCAREIQGYDIKISSAKIQLWRVGENRTSFGQRIDLCEGCYEKFISFLECYIE